MPTVKLFDPKNASDRQKREFDAIQDWFNIDFIPQMSLVKAMMPKYDVPHTRFMKQLMPDDHLSRGIKEMVAVAVSTMNACDY